MQLASEKERNRGGPAKKVQALELGVFLSLVVPAMVLSFFGTTEGDISFIKVAAASIVRDIGLVLLVLYFVWRNKESHRAIGLRAGNLSGEIMVGILLFIPLYLLLVLLEYIARLAGLETPGGAPAFLIPSGLEETLVAYVLLVVVAFSEEVLFRGYLIRRFHAVTNSKVAAVLLSSGIFAFGHVYEGGTGVLVVGILGVFFAVVYLWRGSLIAPIVLHFFQNFMGMIVLPSLMG